MFSISVQMKSHYISSLSKVNEKAKSLRKKDSAIQRLLKLFLHDMTSKTETYYAANSLPALISTCHFAKNVCTLHLHWVQTVTELQEGLQVLTEWLTQTSAPPKPSFAGLSRIRVGVALHIRWETHSALCLLQAGLAFPVCWQHTSSRSRFRTCERGKALFATTSGFLHLKSHGWSSRNNI